MKTIDIFANVVGQMAQDTHVQRYGTILVSSGVGGLAGLDPTAVWVDATIAVIEAISSYFRYCAEMEVTQQLRDYNVMLEATLAHEMQIDNLELEALRRERKYRLAHIDRTLITKRNCIRLTHNKVRQQLDVLKRIHVLLEQDRQKMGSFQELIGLQVCLDCCIDATLALLLSPNGEHA